MLLLKVPVTDPWLMERAAYIFLTSPSTVKIRKLSLAYTIIFIFVYSSSHLLSLQMGIHSSIRFRSLQLQHQVASYLLITP